MFLAVFGASFRGFFADSLSLADGFVWKLVPWPNCLLCMAWFELFGIEFLEDLNDFNLCFVK